jgi:hypothetical protein
MGNRDQKESILYPVNLQETEELIRHHLTLLWAKPDRARAIAPIMLWGPPGVGKSAIIRDLCKTLDIGFVDVRLAQREPVDVRGLPVPKGDRVEWLISSEWPRDPASQGIILFDELTAADRTLQVAAYEFILDRRLGDLYSVPDGWYVMAAGNRVGDRAVATTLSSALANRFCHLEVIADLESWVGWAQVNNVAPEVIAFLRFSPHRFFSMTGNTERGWPSPRSWERLALLSTTVSPLSERAKLAAFSGLVGDGAATEFVAFSTWAEQLPNVQRYLSGKGKIQIPPGPEMKYALCAAVIYYLWRAKDQELAIGRTLSIATDLPADFSAVLMVDLLRSCTQEQIMEVLSNGRFDAWRDKHGEVFTAWADTHAKGLAASIEVAAGGLGPEGDGANG